MIAEKILTCYALCMFANRFVIGALCFYILFSVSIIYSSVTSFSQHDSMRLFIKDPNATERLTAAIASDNNMVFIARLFHNKVLVSLQVFTDSIYRSVDIPFLFSLTERTALYDNPGKIQMLPPFELPLFLLAIAYCIRYWVKIKKYAVWMIAGLMISLFFAGLLWPFIFPIKLIPLMVWIQSLIFLGCIGWIEELVWRKK